MSDRVHSPSVQSRASRALVRTGLALLVVVPAAEVCSRLAGADMIQTIDGKWQPLPADPRAPGTTLPPPAGDDLPTNEYLVDSEGTNVDANYETVKTNRGFNKPASQVKRIVSTEGARNQNFQKGQNDASQKLFANAAESFRAAAAEVSGFAKQEALWLAAQALTETQDAARVTTALDELVAAFPKTFYLGEAQIIRAKIAAAKGDVAGVNAALDVVKNAPGMNVRDLYRAEYARVSLTLELQKKYDEAAAAYRSLIDRMDKEKDPAVVATTRQQSFVGLGNCLLATKKAPEAKGHFERATESRDADVLAGAYAGLGDVAFLEASELRNGGKLEDAKKRLETAVLHYLRVTEHYRNDVTNMSPVLASMQNAAKVFTVLFEMSGSKDCDLASRGMQQYYALHSQLEAGDMRRQIGREYEDLKRRRDECKAKAAPPPPPADAAMK